jgi:Recombination endonuclease VII
VKKPKNHGVAWKDMTPEHRARISKSRKAWRKANRDKSAHYDRVDDLKKYDMTVDDYDRMLREQNGVCAICRRLETSTHRGKVRRLAIDHDHATGRVRGLLCSSHNNGLGRFSDDPALLRAAADYLEKHR